VGSMKNALKPPFFFIFLNLILLTIFTSTEFAEASSTEITFSPAKVLVKEDSNFTVQVQILNSPPFTMFWITLNYNTTVLDALNANVTPPWENPYINIDENQGKIDISSTTQQPLEGNQTIATITFKAILNSNSTLQFTDTQIYDPQLDPIPHTTKNAQIEIVGPLNLTVQTTKEYYYLGENITIYGNTTIKNSPVSCLVGLEVWTLEGTKLTRIVNSGVTESSDTWPLNVLDFYPSDDQANPKSSFSAGTQSHFTVNIENLLDENIPLLLTVNLFDKYNTPFGIGISQTILPAGTLQMHIISIYVPSQTTNGDAKAYLNIFSKFPREGGVPYIPERSASFQITGGSTITPPTFPPYNQTFSAQYNVSFRLPPSGGLAKWKVYSTASYKIQKAKAETDFIAANLFVDDDKPADFNTIQSAINAAHDMDTIYIYNGTYYENINVNKTLSIVGENNEATIIDGRKLDTVINITRNHVKIINFKIINSGIMPYHNAGISIFNYSCMIWANVIANNTIGIEVQSFNFTSILENRIYNNTYGIIIANSSYTDIFKNLVANNSYGIYLCGASTLDTEISGEAISNYVGIYMFNSCYSKITDSSILNNYYGIVLSGDSCNHNRIQDSQISLNRVGLTLNLSQYNIITGNNISNNLNYGIWIYESNNNQIYNNNFIDNGNHTYVVALTNYWNSDYPQGGNYWDTYNGIDEKNGPNQDKPGSDGIGDVPYQIWELENVDHYPLMKPTFIQDIGVTNIFLSKTIVAQGFPMRIYIGIVNYGNKQQHFNLTVYFNETYLTSKTVNLPERCFTLVTFWWDTTDVEIGNYTISAYISPVEDEANLTNNNLTSTEYVKLWPLAADFNLDGRVSPYDFAVFSIHYGGTPSSPKWDPNFDINEDDKIGPYDFAILSINYGKKI